MDDKPAGRRQLSTEQWRTSPISTALSRVGVAPHRAGVRRAESGACASHFPECDLWATLRTVNEHFISARVWINSTSIEKN